jgi:hypothetical protein
MTTDTRHSRIGRPLNEDERALLTHVRMWGNAAGYPVRKYKTGKWTWNFLTLGSPVLYGTKRAAIASLEAFLACLREASGEEAYARAIDERDAHATTIRQETHP